jgi:hypothetical protein
MSAQPAPDRPLAPWPALPAAIRNSQIVTIVAAMRVDVVATAPIGCPGCGVARTFYTLTKDDPRDPWTYRCASCHDGRRA